MFDATESIYLHSDKNSGLVSLERQCCQRAVRLVSEAIPLNEGPKEQVKDLLDVLCAEPAPVIHQEQAQQVQGQVSQSCL